MDENEVNPAIENESQDFDLDAAITAVSEKVLAGEKSEPETAELPLGETVPAVPAEQNEGTPAVAIKPLPKAWKKDMASHWEKLPPEVHEYVYAREADVMRGIQQYQANAQQWNAVIQPFAQVFQQNPGVQPVQLMQNLMNAHMTLLSAPPEQKRAFAQKMLQDYGINLAPGEAGAANPLESELHALRQELYSLKSGFTDTQRKAYEAAVADQRKQVDAFFSDPKNEFAEELQADILRLLQTGAATDLPTAYEQAQWLNPAVRAKLLAKQQVEKAAGQQMPAQGKKFPNIESDPNARPSGRRVKTMDETIDGIVAKYAADLN
jgi:hypothetical protein